LNFIAVENGKPDYRWQGKIILIGEDDLTNFRLLEIILSNTKVTLIHAKTGTETLKMFKDYKKIDLILLDIKMPEMDGIEVTREIRKINLNVPIIIQTAFALDEERVKSMKAGCNVFLTKPIKQIELLMILNSFIR